MSSSEMNKGIEHVDGFNQDYESLTNHLQPHTASSSNEDFFSSPEWTSITDPSPALTDSLSFEFDSSCDPSPLLTDFNYDENDEEGIHGFASAPLFGPSDQIYGGEFNKSSNDFPLFGDSTSSAPQEATSSKANGGEGSSPRRAAQLAFSRSLVDNSAPSSGAQSNEDGSNATFALFRALSSTGLQHSGITATAPIENATANPLNISSPPKTILNDFNVSSSSSTSTSAAPVSAPAPTPAPAPQVKAVAPAPAQGHGNNTGRRGTKRRLDTSDLLPLDAPIQPRHYYEMGEADGEAPTVPKSKPTILVPPRGSMGFLFANGSAPGFSPGPITLVSSLFPEHSPFSFSQLLAGAMASPLAAKPGFLPAYDSGKEDKQVISSDKPMNFVTAQQPSQLESMNPLFMVPPCLSPSGLLNSPGYLSPLQSPFGMSHQQALAHVTAQAALSQSYKQMQAEYQHSLSTNFGEPVLNRSSVQAEALTQPTNPLPPEPETSKKEPSEVSQSDKVTACDKPNNDGYNWRKYGQKHVKASECPRSYYKCTHPNCPAKKKVERSLDGRISEITYKGEHNHDCPRPNKREKDACILERPTNSQVKPVSVSQDQIEAKRINETINVNSVTANPRATSQKSLDHHPVTSHNDDLEDTVVVVEEGDAVEPTAKRRNLDIGQSLLASSHQPVGESKIVLQTRSEVDLLDDGYKWRKYGQKVVKGNPHPRSYYRCTYAGCNVRKHVERASADPKSVITTYEGKHNHDIPLGRYSSQLKAQKVVHEDHSLKKEIDYGNKEQIPTTLQLKEERIAA